MRLRPALDFMDAVGWAPTALTDEAPSLQWWFDQWITRNGQMWTGSFDAARIPFVHRGIAYRWCVPS